MSSKVSPVDAKKVHTQTKGGVLGPINSIEEVSADRIDYLRRHAVAAMLTPKSAGDMVGEPRSWMLPKTEPQTPPPRDTEQQQEESSKEPGARVSFAEVASLTSALANGFGMAGPSRLLKFVDHQATQAFVAEAEQGDLYVSCRGTSELEDLNFAKTVFEPQSGSIKKFRRGGAWCKQLACCGWDSRPLVPMGFYRCFLALVPMLRRYCDPNRSGGLKRITFVGHSLGGALATLSAAFFLQTFGGAALAAKGIAIELFTIGSPRVGTRGFVRLMTALSAPLLEKGLFTATRLVNDVDIAPRIPPEALGFEHIGDLHLIVDEDEKEAGAERAGALHALYSTAED
jgi:hypothetical protein